MEIVCISCSNKKLSKLAKAKDLYDSPLFNMSWNYANKLKPDKIYILSAKYGLVTPNAMLKPYNVALNSMSAKEIKIWAEMVKNQMRQQGINFSTDKVIFLAGNNYRKYIAPLFEYRVVPMAGLGIGKQLKFLKERV